MVNITHCHMSLLYILMLPSQTCGTLSLHTHTCSLIEHYLLMSDIFYPLTQAMSHTVVIMNKYRKWSQHQSWYMHHRGSSLWRMTTLSSCLNTHHRVTMQIIETDGKVLKQIIKCALISNYPFNLQMSPYCIW